MDPIAATRLILNYRSSSTYALNVLLGSIETDARLAGIDVVLARNPDDVIEAIHSSGSDAQQSVVCWSFYSPDFVEVSKDLAHVKQATQSSNAIHIAGGVHATAEPVATARAGFDYVAIGEGEITIRELIYRTVSGGDLRSIKGLGFADSDGFHTNGPGERILLDEFPPFAEKHHRFNPIEITRGCIYACSFCQTPFMFKARFRHRSIENICSYVKKMKDKGLTDVRFITPTSLSYGSQDESVRLDRIQELLESVRNVLGNTGRIFFGSFPSEVRPEHVSDEALELLKAYVENDNIIIGAQSGSNRVLDQVHRGHDAEVILEAVDACNRVGFLANVDFIFGLPGERAEDVEASLNMAEELARRGARVHGHTFMPLPGTPLKDSDPGRISHSARKRLNRLVSNGALYGQWRQQETIARSLATQRREGSERPGNRQ